MKTIFLLLFTVFAANYAYAQDSQNKFCQELIKQNIQTKVEVTPPTKTKVGMGKQFNLIFNILFKPNNIIDIEELQFNINSTTDASNVKESQNKLAFLFIKKIVMTKEENQKLKKLKKSFKTRQKKMQTFPLMDALKQVVDMDKCLDSVNKYQDQFKEINDLSKQVDLASPLFKRKQDSLLYKIAKKKMSFLKRKGWKIIEDATFYQANQLMQGQVSAALFITHSTSDGKLIDAQDNVFPSHFFKALPKSIRKVFMYSCHSKAVIKHYGIDHSTRHFEYLYPVVKNQFRFLFDTTIPIISLGKIKKSLANISIQRVGQKDLCQIDIESRHAHSGYSLYLNKKYVGSFTSEKEHSSFRIECEQIQDINYINIYRTKNAEVNTSDDQFLNITLIAPEKNYSSKLENHYSKINNNHIVSKVKLTKGKR